MSQNNSVKKPSENSRGIRRMNTMKNNTPTSAFGAKISSFILGGNDSNKDKKVEEPKPVKRKDSVQFLTKVDKLEDLSPLRSTNPLLISPKNNKGERNYELDQQQYPPNSIERVTKRSMTMNTNKNLPSPSLLKNLLLNSNEKNTIQSRSPERLHDIIETYEPVSPKKEPLHNIKNSSSANVRVIARFRPINNVEKDRGGNENLIVDYPNNKTCKIGGGNYNTSHYTLDRIFNSDAKQETLFKVVAKETIDDVLNGFNGTIFTYGQSGSGKTFTMYGTDLYDDTKGIIPRSIDYIWDFIEKNDDIVFELRFSMLEIYKEVLYDLLNDSDKPTHLKIKEHPKKGPYIDGLIKEYIENKEDLIDWILLADELRATAETGLNKTSSRSHLLFTLEMTQKMPDNSEKRGILNMIDLAGSEKLSKTGAEGDRLKEALKINLSLHTLGNVIHALSSSANHIPYNESKLTKILKNSLGGNFKTTLIVTCSPHLYNIDETVSTLQFAQRAKKIKNIVKANINKSPEELEKIIEDLQLKLLHMTNMYKRERDKNKNKEVNGEEYQEFSMNEDNNFNNLDGFNLDQAQLDLDNLNNLDFFGSNKLKTSDDINNKQNNNPNNANIQKILNQKEQELEKLKDEVEGYKEEIKILTEKVANLTCDVNFEKSVAELKELNDDIIHDIMKLKQKYTFEMDKNLEEENKELRRQIIKSEEKFNVELKKIKLFNEELNKSDSKLNLESEFNQKLNHFNKQLFTQMESLKKKIGNENKELVSSYGLFYSNSKIMFSSLLQDFLIKDDLFDVENEKYKNNTEKKKEIKLKNSFIKAIMVMIYYEKTLFEGLNKISLDINKILRSEYYENQYNLQMKRFSTLFANMIPLLDQIKDMKIYNVNGALEINDVENGATAGIYGKKLKPGTKRHMRKKVSTKKSAKVDFENSLRVYKDKNDDDKSINVEIVNSHDHDHEDDKDRLNVSTDTLNKNGDNRIYKHNKIENSPEHKLRETPVVKNIGVADVGDSDIISPKIVQSKYRPSQNYSIDNYVKTGEHYEVKSLKSELEMYKEFSVKQTEEINQFKFYADEFTLNIRDYHMKNKELYEIQCINFKSCLEILKDYYLEELEQVQLDLNKSLAVKETPKSTKSKITKFSIDINNTFNKQSPLNTIHESNRFYSSDFNFGFAGNQEDDVENSYVSPKETKKLYKTHRENKQTANSDFNQVVSYSSPSYDLKTPKPSLSDIMTQYVGGTGVATNLNKRNYLSVKYGSGLNKTIPSRSPLERDFKNSFVGDVNNSPDASFEEDRK